MVVTKKQSYYKIDFQSSVYYPYCIYRKRRFFFGIFYYRKKISSFSSYKLARSYYDEELFNRIPEYL